MGKVKQTIAKVSKPAVKENKILKKKIAKKKGTKNNDFVPVLKKMGIDALLNEVKPETSFKFEEDDEKPVKSLIARSKTDFFDEDQIQSGVSALFKLAEKTSGKNPTLFEDGETIFLQIACIKVPKTPTRQVHLDLEHPLLKSDSEICLIVQDREDPKDYDNTIEFYENLLKKNGITNIKCIIPYHQFNNEYAKQFELKRKLESLYDFFLVDAAVHGYVVVRLGKIFYTKRKMPVAVNMKATNLKHHFENILKTTVLRIHSKSDSYCVEVGNTKMKPEEVGDNVIAICEALNEHFPGGCKNVRTLSVKTNKSISIPLYLTLKKNRFVNVPLIKPKRPEDYKAVSGELTTYNDRSVVVLPTGRVIVRDNKKGPRKEKKVEQDFQEQSESDEGEEELDFQEQSESEDEEPKPLIKKMKQEKKKAKKDADLEEEESENSNLEEAEENYLNFYKQEQVKIAKERKDKKRQNEEVEESEDDLHLENSDDSDFEEGDHPNFEESSQSDFDEAEESGTEEAEESNQAEPEEVITKKAGKAKPAHKKGTQNAKTERTNGSAKQSGGKKAKFPVKEENVEVKQETKGHKKGKKENKVEVIPIQTKKENLPKGGNKKGKQEVLETPPEKTFGKKNTKLTKKQKENDEAHKQKKTDVVTKQDKKAVLTKQNNNAASPKQNGRKRPVEAALDVPVKKVKFQNENKSSKQQQKVDSKSGRKPKNFAKKAK